MKKRIKYLLAFSFILMIGGLFSICYATEVGEDTAKRADVSKIAFEWVIDTKDHHSNLKLKVKNATLVKENSYYVHFSHNKDEVVTVTDTESVMGNDATWTSIIYGYGAENPIEDLIDTIGNTDIADMLATKGDIYIWICELVGSSYSNPQIIVKAKKIDRLEQLPLGQRMVGYFFDDKTSIFCMEETGTTQRNANVKIGIVTDKTILKAIQNKEADSLQKLLTYAQSDNSVFEKKLPVGDSKTIFDSFKLTDEQYYYVYIKLDDENGKYYPIEDVSLYQASGDKHLYNYLEESFEWNIEETPPQKEENTTEPPVTQENNIINPPKEQEKDNTIAKGKLPQTGLFNLAFIASIAAIICIVYMGIKLKKYKDISYKS